MTTKTFTSTSRKSVHGTRKTAQIEMHRYNRGFNSETVYTVEHVGPRQFAVVATTTITSEPATVRHIMGGHQIQCRNCNGHFWYYTGRDLYSLNYECASCGNTISPPSETGACQ